LLASYPETPPAVPIGPDDLSHVAFTSGSTGKPKGILGRHGSLSHFLPWQTEAFQLTSADRFSLLSGLSHDPLQRDIFTPLWVGATLHIPPPDFVANTDRFAHWMADSGVTFAHLTPPMNAILTETAVADGTLSSLQHAFFVGDKLTPDDVTRLRRLAPNVTCINSYGSTETQRAVGYNPIPPTVDLTAAPAVLSVGRGMPDVQLLVLNKSGQLCGVGELGEIHVRSPHLALGYLDDEALTAARFVDLADVGLVTDPMPASQRRAYKTGDLGRYLPDGSVAFAGRADRQIKIRGFRIELGEIEAALARQPDVEKGIVVAQRKNRNQQLVAYAVMGAPETAVSAQDLRQSLAAQLPHFMVPAAVVPLDTLPLTPNGKIDYGALPDVELQVGTGEQVAPRTELEKELVALWEEILNGRPIGVHQNFFELGGHSLLAVQLFTQIEQRYGVHLPLITLFQGNTVAHLAQQIEAQPDRTALSSLVAIQPQGNKTPFFCVHGGAGHVFHYHDLAQQLGEDRPFYGLQPKMTGDGSLAAHRSVTEMAQHYLQEMRTVQPHGPYLLGGFCFGAIVAYEMAQQLLRAGEEVDILAFIDPSTPLIANSSSSTRTIEESLWQEIAGHSQQATRLDWRTFLGNLWQNRHKLDLPLRLLQQNLSIIGRRVQAYFLKQYLKLRPSVPSRLQEFYFMRLVSIPAIREYKPDPYPGAITLFRATQNGADRAQGWEELPEGGLIIHDVDSDHLGVLKRPSIDQVALHLRQALDAT